MKKQIFILLFAVGLTACGNAKQQEQASVEKSNSQATEQVDKDATSTTDIALTDNGVGPIVLGMKVSNIPAVVPNLYDRVEKVQAPDVEEYHFYRGDTALFSAEDSGDGIIDGISIFSGSPIPVKTTNGEIYISK